jgi:hypothetical protein
LESPSLQQIIFEVPNLATRPAVAATAASLRIGGFG